MINVIGIGTLLCPTSVARTCPNFVNFRLTTLSGYKRVFNKVDPSLASFANTAIANISLVESSLADPMVVSLFSIPKEQLNNLLAREFDYALSLIDIKDGQFVIRALACLKSCDAAIQDLAKNEHSRAKALDHLRTRYQGAIWRNDIYPAPDYIEKCRKAAQQHGSHVWENFLDTTFLADETTSLRTYLATAKNL